LYGDGLSNLTATLQVLAVLGILHNYLTLRLQKASHDDVKDTKRLQAWRRLRRSLSGPVSSEEIIHFCPPGCHDTAEAARLEIEQDLCTVFCDHPPCIPAYNKWNKILPPLTWFCAFTCLHKLLPSLISSILKRTNMEALEFNDDDLIGMDDASSFIRQQYARFKKTENFFAAASTPSKLIACCLTLQPAMNVMSAGFQSARLYRDAGRGLLQFVTQQRSPAQRTLETYFRCSVFANRGIQSLALSRNSVVGVLGSRGVGKAQYSILLCPRYLGNDQHEHWTTFRSLGAWNEKLFIAASTPMWVEIGELCLRFIVTLGRWPWRLGLLVNPDSSVEDKVSVATELLQLCEHADPFTLRYKQGLHTVGEVLSEDNLRYTQDVFTKIPATNIISEAAFASAHVRRSTAHGNDATPSTVASNHVLAISKTILDAEINKELEREVIVPAPKRSSKSVSGWHAYVREHRSRASMRQLAAEWSALGEEQRRAMQLVRPQIGPGRAEAGRAPQQVRLVWPSCGDEFYPLAEGMLGPLQRSVGAFQAAWAERVGKTTVKPADIRGGNALEPNSKLLGQTHSTCWRG
jgi:hypothetical protein